MNNGKSQEAKFPGSQVQKMVQSPQFMCEGPSAIFCASPASEEQGREVREIFSQKYEQNKLFPKKTNEGKTDREGQAYDLAICGFFTAGNTYSVRFYVMLACWFHQYKLITLDK